MQRFASGLDEENREREAAIMMETEMNITEFTVEPEMEKVLTDFYVKPYPDIHFVEAGNSPNPSLPLDFYDNDDGFWDDYIKAKRDKMSQNDLIVNRRWFKH
jgi:hypothetical protein